jgi:hypothetical protein
MLSMRLQFAFILAVQGLLWLPARGWAQNPQGQDRKIATWPAALAEMPAGQVTVRYRNGELAIEAKNAPLGDVLRAVCTQMGVTLDFSPGGDEPIFAVLGPGPAKKVILSLLEGSQFNYVTAWSADDPNQLASLIVFPKIKDSNRQETRDSAVQHQVAQGHVSSTPSSSTGVESGKKELMELLNAARAEVANSGGTGFDLQGADVASVFQQVEAQIMVMGDSAATDANSSNTGQQAGDGTSQNPVNRPRHRRR